MHHRLEWPRELSMPGFVPCRDHYSFVFEDLLSIFGTVDQDRRNIHFCMAGFTWHPCLMCGNMG